MKDNVTKIINSQSMKLFFMLCGYFLLVLVLYSICQLINFKNCLGIIQIISIVMPIIIYLINLKKTEVRRQTILIIITYLFILLVFPFIYGKTYDLTVDGNSYHKTAIAFIKNGWNPIYETSTNFQKDNNEIVKFDEKTKINLWVEHYPKATWILAANMYNMTGNIESGKCTTLIFSIMLLIIGYNCLQIILSRKWAAFISLLIVLNPIVLAQLFSYYVDGIMGIMFAIELLLLFLINPIKKQNKLIWIALAAICSIFVNLKFTGLLVSGVLAAIFYFYWLLKYRKDKNFKKGILRVTLYFTVVYITAIFIVGSSAYVKNTIDHQNPLYPIIGKDKVDIITTMQPKSFQNKNMLEKFMISTFSRTENVIYGVSEPKLKLPIMVYRSEIDEILIPDIRIGGFGPFFALTLILSIIILIVGTVYLIKNEKEKIKYITIPIIAILISSILLGENWWARYIPHLYLIPIGSIILLLYIKKYISKQIIVKLLLTPILVVIVLNNTFFIYANYNSLNSFSNINKDLKEMKNSKDLKLRLGTETLYGYYYNLNDKKIKYTVVDKIKKENIRYKFCWRIEVEEK